MCTSLLEDTDSQMKRYVGQGQGGSQVRGLLSPWNWGVSPHGVGVFAHPELPAVGILWRLLHVGKANY